MVREKRRHQFKRKKLSLIPILRDLSEHAILGVKHLEKKLHFNTATLGYNDHSYYELTL